LSTPTVRFAPSPTGHLHLGNARVAVVNWLFARRHGGRFVLRIDDTDRERSRPEFEIAIREDLTWLGLGWDAEFRQSSRVAQYDAAFAALRETGRAYPCYETAEELATARRQQQAEGRPPRYDRRALRLTGEREQTTDREGDEFGCVVVGGRAGDAAPAEAHDDARAVERVEREAERVEPPRTERLADDRAP